MLRSILQKLKRAMSEGKISLKPDKKRKAEQAMDNILNKNSLADLQRRCVNLTLQKRQLSTSENVEEAKHSLSILQKHLEDLEKRKEVIESEMNTVEWAISEVEEKIRNYETSIEKNIFEFTGKQISISNG